MGALVKVLDAMLFVFFLFIAIGAPIMDSQTCLPLKYYPDSFIALTDYFVREFDDYLIAEKPHFFVGLTWLEILIMWPFSIVNLYGIIAGKSWICKACLIFGVSTVTSMVAILAELIGSGRGSEKMLMTYYPFLGLAILAVIRGLLPHSGTRTASGKKKRA